MFEIERDVLGSQFVAAGSRLASAEERIGEGLHVLVPQRGIGAQIFENPSQVDLVGRNRTGDGRFGRRKLAYIGGSINDRAAVAMVMRIELGVSVLKRPGCRWSCGGGRRDALGSGCGAVQLAV